MGRVRITLKSSEETYEFGRQIGRKCKAGFTFLLYGNLGAGKTTFVKGVASIFGVEEQVQSPTFTYLHIYEGLVPIYHFDLYRLKSLEDFLALGFSDYLESDGICLIEWAERLGDFFPKKAHHLHFSYEETGSCPMRYVDCEGDLWDF